MMEVVCLSRRRVSKGQEVFVSRETKERASLQGIGVAGRVEVVGVKE